MQKPSPTAHWLTLPARDTFLLGIRGFEANSKAQHDSHKSGQCLCMYAITVGLAHYAVTIAALQILLYI